MLPTPAEGVLALEKTFLEGEGTAGQLTEERAQLYQVGKRVRDNKGPQTTGGFVMSIEFIKVEIN